jgi:hypothetical protein
MRARELFVSVGIIIDQVISVVVVGTPTIFLVREFRIRMCEAFLQFGEQVPRSRL